MKKQRELAAFYLSRTCPQSLRSCPFDACLGNTSAKRVMVFVRFDP